MKNLFFCIIFIFILVSCKNDNSCEMVVDMKVYISDKQNIRQNYLDNIEYFRIHHLYNDVDTINFSHH